MNFDPDDRSTTEHSFHRAPARWLAASLLVLAPWLGACGPQEATETETAVEPAATETAATEEPEAAGASVPDIVDPDDASDVWASRAGQELVELEAEIEDLTEDVEAIDEGARAALLQSAAAINEQIEDARARIEALGEGTDENVEATQALIDQQIDDIEAQVIELSNELADDESEAGE